MPFEGDYTQEDYAQQLIDEYKAAGVDPRRTSSRSPSTSTTCCYWIANEPEFGRQAVYLDDRDPSAGFDVTDPATWSPGMQELADAGVKIIAPPMWMLLALDATRRDRAVRLRQRGQGRRPRDHHLDARALRPAGRRRRLLLPDGRRRDHNDGDMFKVLDVLAQEVGVLGVFSDWPATVTYYANCMGLE